MKIKFFTQKFKFVNSILNNRIAISALLFGLLFLTNYSPLSAQCTTNDPAAGGPNIHTVLSNSQCEAVIDGNWLIFVGIYPGGGCDQSNSLPYYDDDNDPTNGSNYQGPVNSDILNLKDLNNDGVQDHPDSWYCGGNTIDIWTVWDRNADPTDDGPLVHLVITVNDNQLPTITCPSNLTINGCDATADPTPANGTDVTADFTDGDSSNGEASDNCGVTSVVLTKTDNGQLNPCALSPLVITNTYTVTDECGNTSTCTQTVTIYDSEAPSAVCQDVSANLNGTCTATVNATDIDNGSSDNCTSAASLTLEISRDGGATWGASVTFTSADIVPGNCPMSMPVTLRVTDNCGNSSTCDATVSLNDITPPVANCVAGGTVNKVLDANCEATLNTTEIDNGSSDNCGNVTLGIRRAGTTDAFESSLTLDANDLNCASGTILIELQVTDDCGNTSTCTTSIGLTDNTAPTATCSTATIDKTLDDNCEAVVTAAEIDGGSSDNCGNVTLGIRRAGTGDPFVSSLTLDGVDLDCDNRYIDIELQAEDDCGNTSTCIKTIGISDDTAPVAVCYGGVINKTLDASCEAIVAATEIDGGSYDNCDSNPTLGIRIAGSGGTFESILTLSNTDLDCTTGTIDIEMQVMDDCDNTATCTKTIGLIDDTAPVANCVAPNTLDIFMDSNCEATVSAIEINDGGSTDNCDNDLTLGIRRAGTADAFESSLTLTEADLDCGTDHIDIELEVTDDCGNTDRCTTTIGLTDDTDPVAVCTSATIDKTLDNNCEAVVTAAEIDGGSSDNCSNFTIGIRRDGTADPFVTSLTLNSGDLDCGTNEIDIELQIIDDCGNEATCFKTIGLTDDTAPVVICSTGPINKTLDANCEATVDVSEIDNGSSDNCDNSLTLGIRRAGTTDAFASSLTLDNNDLDCNTGTIDIELQAEDDCGNTATCTRSIGLIDGTPPTAACIADNTLNLTLDATSCEVTIDTTDINENSSDNCGPVTMGIRRAGTTDPFTVDLTLNNNDLDCTTGTINIELQVTDACGNTDNCVTVVGLTDNTAPTATCQNVSVNMDASTCTITVDAADINNGSTDNCSSALTLEISRDGGTTWASSVDFDDSDLASCPQDMAVSLRVTDECSNSATCDATVTLNDVTAPTWTTAAGDLDRTVECSDAAGLSAAQALSPAAQDNCSGSPTVTKTAGSFVPGSCPNSGTYTNTFVATDDCGNASSTYTQVITVEDNTAPDALCVADHSILLSLGSNCQATLNASDVDNGSTDNCSAVADLTLEISKDGVTWSSTLSYDDTDLGSPVSCPAPQTVHLRVTDECGNSDVCTTIIDLTDDEDPVAVCPADRPLVEVGYDYDNCDFTNVVVPANSLGDGSSTDNCTNPVTETNLGIIFTCINEGIRQWTLTAEDACGNTNSVECDIEVKLTQEPADWTNPGPLCSVGNYPFDLKPYVVSGHPECGYWTGDNVDSVGMFNPPGPGSYSVTFNVYGSLGCEIFLTRVIEVVAPAPNTTSTTIPVLCSTDMVGNVSLTDLFPGINNEYLDNSDPAVTITVTAGGPGSASLVGGSVAYDGPGCVEVRWQYDDPLPCDQDRDVTSYIVISEQPQPEFDIQDQICFSDGDADVVLTPSLNSPTYQSLPGNIQRVWSVVDNVNGALVTIDASTGDVTISDEAGSATMSGTYVVTLTETISYDACGNVTAGDCTGDYTITGTVNDGTGLDATFTVDNDEPCIGDVVTFTANTSGGVFTGDGVNDNGDGQTATLTVDDCSVKAITYTVNSPSGCTNTYTMHLRPDHTDPVLTLPSDMTVECDGNGNTADLNTWLATASATDNCGNPDLTNILFNSIAGCSSNTGQFVYEFTATDECGNETKGYATFTIEDTTAPDINPTASDLTVECDGQGNDTDFISWLDSNGGASASDVCGDSVVWTNDYDVANWVFDCGITKHILVTFTATDACGNSSTTSATFTIHDTTDPSLDAPADIALECNDPNNAAIVENWLNSATSVDGCDIDVEITNDFTSLPTTCVSGSNYVDVTFTATDDCGNSTTETRRITIEDNTDPYTYTDPTDLYVECDGNGNTAEIDAWLATNGGWVPADNCDNDLTVTYTNAGETTLCGGAKVITYIFYATDDCGNVGSTTAYVHIEDTTDPVINVLPDPGPVECHVSDPDAWAASATATDDCSSVTLTYAVQNVQATCVGNAIITYVFTAIDDCGNTSTATGTYTIVDTTPPALTAPADLHLNCDDDIGAYVTDWLDNYDVFDNCSSAGLLTVTNDFDASTIPDPICDVDMLVTWTAVDDCGNTSTATAHLYIVDDVAPTLYAPDNLVLECGDPNNDGIVDNWLASASAVDNCDNDVELTDDFNGLPTSCVSPGNEITITFIATDNCSNSTVAYRTIRIEDTTEPYTVTDPEDLYVECDGNGNTNDINSWLSSYAGWIANDQCDDMLEYRSNYVSTNNTCGNSEVQEYQFIAEDDCGNETTVVAYVHIVDTTDPVIDVPADPGPVECDVADPETWAGGATASDVCGGNITLTFAVQDDDETCEGSTVLTYVFTAVDECGNSSTATGTYTIVDTTDPIISAPADLHLNCNDDIGAFVTDWLDNYNVYDNCSNAADIVVTNDFDASSIPDPACDVDMLVTWTAADDCGNTSTASAHLFIVDDENPVLYAPTDLVLECGDPNNDGILNNWFSSATAVDNCDNDVEITNNFNSLPDACDPMGNEVSVTFTATDNCGNTTSETRTIRVEDTTEPYTVSDPTDLYVECDGAGNTAEINAWLANNAGWEVQDQCDTDLDITNAYLGEVAQCGNTKVITYGFNAFDNCGNVNTAIAYVHIEDNTDPVINVPADPGPIECDVADPESWALQATATDVCSDNVTLTFAIQDAAAICVGTGEVTYIFTAIDDCGNTATATGTYTIIDTTAPELTAPNDLHVHCGDDITSAVYAWLHQYTVFDNCSSESHIVVTNDFTGVPDLCGGSVVVTWTATDDCGNSTTAQSNLIVDPDDDAPVFVNCPDDMTVNIDVDLCTRNVIYSTPVATDCNEPVTVTLEQGIPSGQEFPLGTTHIQFKAVDNCGNEAFCDFDITVTDSQDPSVLCPSNTVHVSVDEGVCTWTADDQVSPRLTFDNCPYDVTYEISGATTAAGDNDAAGEVLNRGTNTICYTITEENGGNQVSTCCFDVEVYDGVAPTFECPPPMNVAGCAGSVPDLTNLVTNVEDNCDASVDVSFTQNPVEGTLFGPDPDDQIIVTVTGTDLSGNSSSCEVVLTIIDTEDPYFVNCPVTTVTVANDPDQCSALVNWSIPVAMDNCDQPVSPGSIYQTEGPEPGTEVAVGTTFTVTYEATDEQGHTTTCSFDVLVVDTQEPEILVGKPQDETVSCDNVPEPLVLNSNDVEDNCTDQPTIEFVQESTQGNNPAECDYYTYTLTNIWTVSDEYQNAQVWNQVINVVDDVAPIMTMPANDTIECSGTTPPFPDPAVTGMAAATDNCAAQDYITISYDDMFDPGACGFTGTVYRTWTATDPCGNSTSGVQIIVIEDTTAPDLECQDITVELDENGEASITATDVIVSVSDACSDPADLSYQLDKMDFTCDDIGDNVVTLTVTDACGNAAVCQPTVTVVDLIAPVISNCPGDMSVYLDGGDCQAFLQEEMIASDNCSFEIIYTHPYDQGFDIGSHTVVNVAIDPSGNTDTCKFDLEVIEHVPSSNAMACNDLVLISLDGNCTAELNADMILEGDDYFCYDNYCISVVDDEGNEIGTEFGAGDVGNTYMVTVSNCEHPEFNCMGQITIFEKFEPEIECPADAVVGCNGDTDPSVLGTVTILNCEPFAEISYEDEFIDNGNCGTPRANILRTWTVDDNQGNVVSCIQNIQINGSSLEDVVFPDDIDGIECSDVSDDPGLTEPFNTGYPTIDGIPVNQNNGLCMFSFNYSDEIYTYCGGSYEILRTWKVRSMCGPATDDNPIKHTQVIKVSDSQAPVIHSCSDVTVSAHPYECVGNIELEVPMVNDNCGSFDFKVGVNGGHVTTTGNIHDGTLRVFVSDLSMGTYKGQYIATDECSNVSVCDFSINVVDNSPPIPNCEQYKQVSITADGNARVFADDFDSGSFDNCNPVYFKVLRVDSTLAYDGGCDDLNGDDNPFTSSIDVWYDDDVYFCCEDVANDIMVSMRVFEVDPGAGPVAPNRMKLGGDLYGHYNDCWSIVHVECKIPPILDCPDLTVTCEESLDPNENPRLWPDVDQICGVELDYSDNRDNGVCGANIIRTWTATGCEMATQCKQKISVESTEPFDPCTIRFPRDVKADCSKELRDGGEPTWDENPCNVVTAEIINEDTFNFVDGACYKIVREWAVIDWCVYEQNSGAEDNIDAISGTKLNCSQLVEDGYYRYTQILMMTDVIPPVINVEDQCVATDDCYAYDVEMDAFATDSCNVNQKFWWKYIVTNMDTWETVQYSYNYTPRPDSGRKGSRSKDNIDNTNAASLVLLDPLPKGNYRVTWTVGDGCGNANSKNQYFTVADKKAPTPVMVDIATANMENGMVELKARSFDKGGCEFGCLSSYDNCTEKAGLYFTYTDVLPRLDVNPLKWQKQYQKYGRNFFDPITGNISTEANYFNGTADAWLPVGRTAQRAFLCDFVEDENTTITIQIYVWDQFALNGDCDDNNYDFANVLLNINHCKEEPGNLAGMIRDVNTGSPAVGMNVVADDGENKYETITDNSGYKFNSLPGGAYEVSAVNNENFVQGITTLDLVIIQKKLLGLKVITDPYKLIAADANNNGYISASDLLELRKVILGAKSRFANNSWVGISTDYVFKNVAKAEKEASEARVRGVYLGSAGVSDANFVAVKIGDMNGSAGKLESRSGNSVTMMLDNMTLKAGQEVEVPFYAKDFNNVYGAQFTMNVSDINVEGIASGALQVNESNINVVNDNLVMSWNNAKGVSLDDGTVLFTLTLKSSKNTNLSNVLNINDQVLRSEAYTGSDLEINTVKLEYRNSGISYALYQNEPNPFTEETVIGFELPETAAYTLTVYDVTGKVLVVRNAEGKAGYNAEKLSKKDLNVNGVLYYRLESGDYTATKKMIVIK